ncbi:MAG: uracil-DNA glycosylase family protein [Candidatus Methanospirareceae archaeon]
MKLSPSNELTWNHLQEEIKRCRMCGALCLSGVQCPDARVPTIEPRAIKLLFISEAPPLNSQSYFFNERSNDRLRTRLFGILRDDVGLPIETISDFVAAGFYLLPTVKCPSAREAHNTAPGGRVIQLCADTHLSRELTYIKPVGICLLGRTALQVFLALCEQGHVRVQSTSKLSSNVSDLAGTMVTAEFLGANHTVMVIPSYWPTKRHRKYHEIGEHIKQLMAAIGF